MARRRAHALRRSTRSARRRSRPSRRSGRRTPAPASRRRGSTAKSSSAATASQARSCPRRRCSRATRVRPIPTSTMRCPEISVAAGPMCAFARPSSRPRRFEEAVMIITEISRRKFLATAAGGAFVLGLRLSAANGAETTFTPNAFIRIGADDRIVLTMPYVEMGQGTYTSIPMLIAEELEVGLDQVKLEHAPPNAKLYANPLLGEQATGNSNAIRGAWKPLREAGATARTMLVAAAAKRWNVDPSSCHAQSGEVLHVPTGRRTQYGALAADAALMPVPPARRSRRWRSRPSSAAGSRVWTMLRRLR